MAGKKKSINLLLNDGDLDGVVMIEDSAWVSGAMYAAPRDAVNNLLSYKESSYSGIYFLLSADKVYVGQAGDLKSRIKQHLAKKDWWDQVVLLTTNNDSFTHTDIDYLEAHFIKLAQKYHHLDVENKKGETAKVSKFDQIKLDDYIEEALFLLEQIMGINVFSSKKPGTTSLIKNQPQPKAAPTTKTAKPKQLPTTVSSKSDALALLSNAGLTLKSNQCTFASMQKRKVFWANPSIDFVKKDWDLILNDSDSQELIYIHIPANTFKATDKKKTNNFVKRKDKPDKLDINIYQKSLLDMYSDIDLNPYVVQRYSY